MTGTMNARTWLASASAGTISNYVGSTLYTVIDSFREFVMLHEDGALTIAQYLADWNNTRK